MTALGSEDGSARKERYPRIWNLARQEECCEGRGDAAVDDDGDRRVAGCGIASVAPPRRRAKYNPAPIRVDLTAGLGRQRKDSDTLIEGSLVHL